MDSTTSWETSKDNINWQPATIIPDNNATAINIRSSHTISLGGSTTAKKLTIEAGGNLNTNNNLLTITDAAGTDLNIAGILQLWGKQPVLGTGTAVVQNGGSAKAVFNSSPGESDDFAYNTSVTFLTGSVFEWNNTSAFEMGRTYFPNAITDMPIFKVTKNVSGFTTNPSGTTTFNGLFQVDSTTGTQPGNHYHVKFDNSGDKIFKYGIGGTDTLSHKSSSGRFLFNTGTPTIYGTLKLFIERNSSTTSDMEVQSGVNLSVTGTDTIRIGTSTSTDANLLVNGILTHNSNSQFDLSYGNLNIAGTGSVVATSGNFIASPTGTNIRVTGSSGGSAGTVRFLTGASTIKNLQLSRTGTGSALSLGSDMGIAGIDSMNAGNLNINAYTLTLSGTVLNRGGFFNGTSSSNITIAGTGSNVGTLAFATGGNTLNTLTINRTGGTNTDPARVVLGNSLTTTNLVLTNGIVVTGDNLLTLNSISGLTRPTDINYKNSFIATCDSIGNQLQLSATIPFNGSKGFRINNVGNVDSYFPVAATYLPADNSVLPSPNRMMINNRYTPTHFTVVVNNGDINNAPAVRVNRVWYVKAASDTAVADMKLYFTMRDPSQFGTNQNEVQSSFQYSDVRLLQKDYSNSNDFISVSDFGDVQSYFYTQGVEASAQYTYGVSPDNLGRKIGVTKFNRFTVGSQPSITVDYFRTIASNSWDSVSTWETSHDNITWQPATRIPDNNASAINIRSTHNVPLGSTTTAKKLTVEAGGILNKGLNVLTIADATGTDFSIAGTFQLSGRQPILGTGTAVVQSGGLVKAVANNSQFESDDFAYNPGVSFLTGSTFQWDVASAFEMGKIYFPNAVTDIPIFKVTRNVSSFNTNPAGITTFNGLFETDFIVHFDNAGDKEFKYGIGGNGTVNHTSASGRFIFNSGNPSIYGTIKLNLDNSNAGNTTSDLEIKPGVNLSTTGSPLITIGSATNASSDFLVNGTFTHNGIVPVDLSYTNLNIAGTGMVNAGTGTITALSTNTNINISGSSGGSAGTLKFTPGSSTIKNLAMSRTGTEAL